MTSWNDVAADNPAFAQRVELLFGRQKHLTLATLRRDGSPRISGMEAAFDRGEVLLGMMPRSCKALDVQRDPRLALHSATIDPPLDAPSSWPGEAKIAGRAVEVTDGDAGGEPHEFRVDVDEVVLTTLGIPADHLVIESWHPDRGLERLQRE